MWAILDYDNKTIVGVYPPDISYETALEDSAGRTLIKMTIENSPAYLGGTYVDGKFYPMKEGN
jgi:hypothetical protein